MTDKMIFRMPSYCDRFRCSADKCSDNCCIGWEIDIDDKTHEFYKSVRGDFGKRLKENIACGDCASFILKGERCPFLNEDNLCDIIINLGEENLCQICSDHPRYFEWYGGLKEGGIGLCCEEAAKLILTEKEPLSFTEREVDYEEGEDFEKELFDCLYTSREKIFEIICDESKSIKEIIGEILAFSEMLQVNIDNYIYTVPDHTQFTLEEKEGDFLAVLKSLKGTEPIDENWEPALENLIAEYKEYEEKVDFFFYQKKLLIYFIYRYFLKGVFDGEILSKVKLGAVSVAVITYIMKKEKAEKKEIGIEEIADICKFFSKQIEYSQENIDLIADLSYSEDIYHSDRIINYF